MAVVADVDKIKGCISTNPRTTETFKRLVTDDEKREPPLPIHKLDLHPKKVMLCIWWDWKVILYYEFLPTGETIYSEKYCSQLERLKTTYFNGDPSKLLDFDWDVSPHAPFSSDIAPSDYHLFRSLQNFLNGKRLTSLEESRLNMEEFLNQKIPLFWRNGIYKLPEKWQYVVANNGV
ncbi:hypothetical protein ANN_09565 [Periplaneta americana]|uniref:Mariner Mos1 transposase n=1 Tax=Periplaneta americana TaxID=6978 RepID=A0ABQ8TNW5_PERAM|nr:hypothetical protein ANN_09565 [Periplaneta americana]